MQLVHLWHNAEDPSQVLFSFEVKDLDHCRRLTQEIHAKARLEHPGMPLPEMIFLESAVT